jgi:hypothetical protein
MDNKVDPWELLAELREHFGSCGGIPDHLWDITDAALTQHEADEKHRKGYGDRLIVLAKAEERKEHFQQGYSDAILDGLNREEALKKADEYADSKMKEEWK